MLTVQAPSGTQLEVPIPDSVCVSLKSSICILCILDKLGEEVHCCFNSRAWMMMVLMILRHLPIGQNCDDSARC